MAADPVYDLIENQKPTRAPGRCSVVRDRGALVCDPRFTVTGIVCAEHCPRAASHGPRGAFEGARVMRTWGLHWDWLERDPNSRIFSQVSMLLRRNCTNVAFAGVEIYRRYPAELHLANALKSVTVVAIWLPE